MKPIIISLGGSLIYPDNIDIVFVRAFKELIEAYIKKGSRFVIFCGGGKLARNLQNAASNISEISNEQKDWLGIEATKINAFLVKSVFSKEQVYDKIINNPTEKISTDKQSIVCSGWKPGWSTDFDAVLMAKNISADKIINMSNIDYVYDSDPKKNSKAKPLKIISWSEFRKLVGETWSPGLNMPFDPIAAKEAEKNKFKVIIIGKDLNNLKKVLDGNEFEGTIIS
jgi:uridylate kinase